MKKLLFLIVAFVTIMPVAAQEYRHSLGLTLGSLNGLSYKYWATDKFAFQVDFGFQAIETRTSGILVKGPDFNESATLVKPITYLGGRINPNLMWHQEVSEGWNLFLGGGFSADLIGNVDVKHLDPSVAEIVAEWESSDKYAVKFGINAIAGFEYCFDGQLNISLDFRPGYTCAYDNLIAGYKYYLGAFDWNLCLGLRYRFE